MKDFIGNELSVGSEIAFIEPGYRNLARGTIYAITAKRIKVEIHNRHAWQQKQTVIEPTVCVKIGGQ